MSSYIWHSDWLRNTPPFRLDSVISQGLQWSLISPKHNLPSCALGRVCVCVLSHVWLCDSMDCRLPGSSILGISQARILEWAAISFRGDLPDAFFTTQPPGKPSYFFKFLQIVIKEFDEFNGWGLLYSIVFLERELMVSLSGNFKRCLAQMWKIFCIQYIRWTSMEDVGVWIFKVWMQWLGWLFSNLVEHW